MIGQAVHGETGVATLRRLAYVFAFGLFFARSAVADQVFRPPAIPLVACDPYFSIWSQADELHGDATRHWTGKPHRLRLLARIDGQAYRVMGGEPAGLAVLKQEAVSVWPTRTVYEFVGGGVSLQLTFATPVLPHDMDLLSRPTTYAQCVVQSQDGNSHDVVLYWDAAGELAVNVPTQSVVIQEESFGTVVTARIGSVDQRVLRTPGDDLRIDWGYFYLAASRASAPRVAFGERDTVVAAFVESGSQAFAALPEWAPGDAVEAGDVVVAMALELGEVSAEPVSRDVVLAYDDLYSIQYMRENLRPYWRRNGWGAHELLQAAVDERAELMQACERFDLELMGDLRAVGGEKYAEICALAYRQCFAAGKFVVDANGQPLQFSKENHSNGCIATSDVFYPMAPQFLLFGPSVAKSFIVPFMNYAESSRWKFPFAPHDLGTYPLANGQRYGGGETSAENQMPVEECGNLLLLMGAVAKMEGNADFASRYWPQLQQWAEYLKEKGFDPENQLCTDDFAGHLAHNVNLSAKAICALGAYGYLCELRGDEKQAREYRQLAKDFSRKWIREADDGDHFRLAFDRPGTWSQKYNLVWDRILGLGIFPHEVLAKEMRYYRSIQNEFGLPLDNRSDYTKLDWVLWTATLTREPADFAALIEPVHHFLQSTPDRSPMTDWYFTSTAKKRGFTARPVVGGVFLRMLYEPTLWKKYASRDRTQAKGWAKMPVPPTPVSLVPTSREEPVEWQFTTQPPQGDWMTPAYNSDAWETGAGGFGTRGTPGARIGTIWNTPDIWLRREFDFAQPIPDELALLLHHDENAEVYLNGMLVAKLGGYTTAYELEPIDASVLRMGRNVLAVHCRQTTGGQYIDVGIVKVARPKQP